MTIFAASTLLGSRAVELCRRYGLSASTVTEARRKGKTLATTYGLLPALQSEPNPAFNFDRNTES